MENDLNILLDVLLPWTLRFIMFGMGLLLSVSDFIRLKNYPRAVIAGLGGQLILLPLVGLGLAVAWNLAPELAIGMIILAACPGGTTSNLVSHLACGDVPLSITLTAVNSFIVVVTIPLYAVLAMNFFIGEAADVPLPVGIVVWSVFNYTIIPVALGMIVHALFPAFTDKIRRPYDILAAFAFVFIVLAVVWESREHLMVFFLQVGTVTLALNLVMTALGLAIGAMLFIGTRQTMTLGIEIGVQNTVLGMAVAGSVLHGVRGLDGNIMLMPAAIYGLIMFLPAVGIILYGRKKIGVPEGTG